MTEPITMYRIRRWCETIKAVEVAKLTAKTAVIATERGTYRERLVSGYSQLFPTWEEARAALLAKAEAELHSARLQLQQLQGKVGNIKGMQKP
jgi:hypothetical protein